MSLVANGLNVDVTVMQKPIDPSVSQISFKLTAICGQTKYEWVHTIGDKVNGLPVYTAATLQAEIDQQKQLVADMASRIELARTLAANVQ